MTVAVKNYQFSILNTGLSGKTFMLLFFSHMSKYHAIKPSLLFFVVCICSCVTVRVYKDTNQPEFYSNSKKNQTAAQSDTLNVVTFNIKKAEKIQLATLELQQFEKTKNVDIYLLQEMDETGVESIANNLGLNYLYIPAVYNKLLKKNIGNAILTKGSIDHPEKLILPHKKWLSKWRRDIAIAEVDIHQKKILVLSVHRETIMMSRKNRLEQVDAVIEHARLQLSSYNYILIGGDFNTLFSADVKRVVKKFNAGGFDWSTAGVGSTARAFFGQVKPKLDYLFTIGLKGINAGKIETSVSSDHYPVFATYRFLPSASSATCGSYVH